MVKDGIRRLSRKSLSIVLGLLEDFFQVQIAGRPPRGKGSGSLPDDQPVLIHLFFDVAFKVGGKEGEGGGEEGTGMNDLRGFCAKTRASSRCLFRTAELTLSIELAASTDEKSR